MKQMAVIAISLVLVLVGMPPAALASGGLVNPSFEEGWKGWGTNWTDSVAVVGDDGYVSPMWGSKMARLGTPRTQEESQPIGPNVIEQTFTVTNPILMFAYQIVTWDYAPFNSFGYTVTDIQTGATVAEYHQTAWGRHGPNLKKTGWQPVNLDLVDYIGRQVRLRIYAGGTRDQILSTWAYVDGPMPLFEPRMDIEFLVLDRNGLAVHGATIWPVWIDEIGNPHPIAGMPAWFTTHSQWGGGGRASVFYFGQEGHYGGLVHYYFNGILHTAVGGVELEWGQPQEVVIRLKTLDLLARPS